MRAFFPTFPRREYSFARRTSPCRTTSILSMRGECKRKLRSTPTPCAMRRTINASLAPLPRQPMTMPSKIWMRSRVPSTTLACTFTVSPGINVGTFLRWDSASSRLMTLDTAYKDNTPDPLLPLLAVEQVRAATARPLGRLSAAPALDLRMVARAKHLGDGMPLELRGPGVVRVFEEMLVEGFVFGRFFGPEHPGDQPADGIDHHHRGELAAGQHVVANRDLLVDQVRGNPLIDALIPSADQIEVILAGKLAHQPLVEQFTLRRQQDHRPFARARAYRFEDRLRLQHHPRAAAIGDIVDLPVAVVRVVAEVMDAQRDQPAGQSPSSDAGAEGAGEHLWEEGQDLDDHAFVSSGRSTVIVPSAGAMERTTLRIIGIKISWSPSVTRKTSFAA